MTSEKRHEQNKQLILATIECINKDGIEKTSIRNIATKAGVNSSAISYYFGSRNQLISKALEITMDNAFNIDDAKILDSDDYHIVLKKILMDWERGAKRYPGITKAHFDDLINDRIQGKTISKRVNRFIDDVYTILLFHGLEDSHENFMKLKLIFNGFTNYLLMPQIINYKSHKDDNVIESLVSMI